ncbi:MAG: cyclase family protein [Actinobacteria bacterium]|nr:MAG: cyclase family protein [Actinomycetota bacterium]
MTATTSERGGNWGRWGSEDERGALNLLTDDAVLAATRMCKTGKLYRLGLPIDRVGGPLLDYRGTPQRLTLSSQTDGRRNAMYGAAPGVGANEDVLVLASHTLTHIDAFSHVFGDDKFYNGFSNDEFASYGGAARCGIEKLNSFAGRAVLLDLPHHQSVDWLELGHIITGDELEACRASQGVEISSGDIVLIRTGFLDFFFALETGTPMPFEQAGIGVDAAKWLAARDVAAVGADNSAVEAIPFDGNEFLAVHLELLVQGGITLMEHLDLREMASDGCYEALLVVAPLPVVGATGSPINPVAIG